MPRLGLGSKMTNSGLITPGIVTDNLVLKHNYSAGSVVPLSDGAASFDGVQDYIKIDTSATDLFTLNTSDFAWAGWIKAETDAASEKIFDAFDGSSNGFFIFISSSGYVRIRCADVAGSFSSETSLRDGLWHHVAVNFDRSGNATCYFDGVLDSTTVDISAEVSDSASCTDDITIGINNDEASEDFKGFLCNIGVWKRLLTQAEVKSIMWKNYAGLTSSETTNLVSWWNLDAPITEDYNLPLGEADDSPSTIDGLVLDNHDTTFTEVSVTNSDFTSGSGTDLTPWDNDEANKWERSGDTIISPNGVSLFKQAVLTNNIAHKVIVRAKNTVPGSTSRLQVYFGGNNHAHYNLTDDFQEYTFHGYQDNDLYLFLYNPTGAASTNVTIDWVKLYKYDGNVGVLI